MMKVSKLSGILKKPGGEKIEGSYFSRRRR
jgi:hypothetical protein